MLQKMSFGYFHIYLHETRGKMRTCVQTDKTITKTEIEKQIEREELEQRKTCVFVKAFLQA